MVGWDVSKYLTLLRKSNPSAIEWLSCPRYVVSDPMRLSSLEELGARCMNPRALAFHYVGMAKENANEFLRIANGEVRLTQRPKTKKYVYVVRALLASRYLIDYGQVPPIQFDELLGTYRGELSDDGVLGHIDALMEMKREGLETDVHERIPDLDVWVMANIADCTYRAQGIDPGEPAGWDEVNEMLIRVLTT